MHRLAGESKFCHSYLPQIPNPLPRDVVSTSGACVILTVTPSHLESNYGTASTKTLFKPFVRTECAGPEFTLGRGRICQNSLPCQGASFLYAKASGQKYSFQDPPKNLELYPSALLAPCLHCNCGLAEASHHPCLWVISSWPSTWRPVAIWSFRVSGFGVQAVRGFGFRW